MSGGRFRVGDFVPIEWLVPSFETNTKDTGSSSDGEYIYLVQQQLIFGFHRGYSVEDNVVARVHVRLHEVDPPVQNSLKMTFEGFVTVALSPEVAPNSVSETPAFDDSAVGRGEKWKHCRRSEFHDICDGGSWGNFKSGRTGSRAGIARASRIVVGGVRSQRYERSKVRPQLGDQIFDAGPLAPKPASSSRAGKVVDKRWREKCYPRRSEWYALRQSAPRMLWKRPPYRPKFLRSRRARVQRILLDGANFCFMGAGSVAACAGRDKQESMLAI
jgi:hypothetical protein